MMTEEQVTKAILSKLKDAGWHILTFDFPQSGTGKMLHHNHANNEKNKGSIIPDIIAAKNQTCLFFENKNRVDIDDFVKINSIKIDGNYSHSINELIRGYDIHRVLFGIGIPTAKWNKRGAMNVHLVDFVICVDEKGDLEFKSNLSDLEL